MLIADLNYQLSNRLSAGQVGLGLPHAFRSERVLFVDVDLHHALAHGVEEELGVMGALLGSDRVVHHRRTDELDVFLREGEDGERGDNSGRVSE